MEFQNYCTDLDWLPILKGVNDSFAIGSVDGSFRIVTRLAKVDKTIPDAHKGAVNNLFFSFFFALIHKNIQN